MGLAISDVYSAVQLMLAPVYVNDFVFEGRVLRVTMQADAPYRMNEEALQRFYLPAGTTAEYQQLRLRGRHRLGWHGAAVVGAAFQLVRGRALAGALQRLPGHPVERRPEAEGRSSGEAMAEMERIVREDLPPGFGLRLGRPVLPGAALGCRSADAVRAVHPRRVPVPRRAVRELGHAASPCCWSCPWASSARCSRPRSPACPTTCSSRSASSPSLVLPPRTPS